MAAQMANFLDQTGGLRSQDKLVGKVASVFASTGSQHGGQETTIISTIVNLMHLGMIVVGVPYSEKRLLEMGEVSGGTPYGATTLAGDGSRQPTENELAIAAAQGRHVAEVTAMVVLGRQKLLAQAA
jgi:NAD(P)H dehydrogenase (quinone)